MEHGRFHGSAGISHHRMKISALRPAFYLLRHSDGIPGRLLQSAFIKAAPTDGRRATASLEDFATIGISQRFRGQTPVLCFDCIRIGTFR